MSVVYFLLMVGVLVSVHELGHFLAAKALGIRVLRFSLGFGPAIASVRGRETEYRIGIIPLGGYVKMLGEDPAELVAREDEARSFALRPLWHRLVVVFAGPAANLLCPLVIYFAFYAGHPELPAAVIGDVFAGGPAAAAGIQPGDRVLEVNGTRIRYWEDLERLVDESTGRMLRVKVRRGNQEVYTYVAPRKHTLRTRSGERSEQGLIGITQAPFEPRVGVLDDTSPAARAGLRTGDRIISVDGEPVESYAALSRALARHPKRVPVAYLREAPSPVGFAAVHTLRAGVVDLVPDKGQAGLLPAEFFVADVEPGSPAARAGLRRGDLITSLDGSPVTHWMLFDQALQAEPDRPWRVGWLRARPGGGVEQLEAAILQERRAAVDDYGQRYSELVFGAHNDYRPGQGEMVPIENRFLYAAGHAVERTVSTTALMVQGFAALLGGELPRELVGGPLTVYRMASVSGQKGWDSFLMMLALISINLGLINLLPIPTLDGGHLVFFAVEALRRQRLPQRVREAVVLAGLVLIVALTVLALRNDIVRYLIR